MTRTTKEFKKVRTREIYCTKCKKYKEFKKPKISYICYNQIKFKTSMVRSNLCDYSDAYIVESFKSKIKITGKTLVHCNTKNVQIAVPSKCLSTFWRTLEMPLINCEISLNLTWSENCVISSGTGKTKFAITDTKLYVSVVILSIEDNIKQLKSGFKRTINCNKYQSEEENKEQNRNFNYLIHPSFQGVNKLFDLSLDFCIIWKVDVKDYVITDGRNFFDLPIKNDLERYGKIRNIANGQGDDCTTGCLLDYFYFKEHYKLIAIDLSKQKN